MLRRLGHAGEPRENECASAANGDACNIATTTANVAEKKSGGGGDSKEKSSTIESTPDDYDDDDLACSPQDSHAYSIYLNDYCCIEVCASAARSSAQLILARVSSRLHTVFYCSQMFLCF